MEHVNTDTLVALTSIVGAESITTLPDKLASGSKDCYHFSPVLIPQLDGKSAEAIVYPNNQNEVIGYINTRKIRIRKTAI